MPKTVVHLSRLFAPHIGGVEIHVAELVKLHHEGGDKVIVVTEQYDTDLSLFEEKKDFLIYRIPKKVLRSKISVWSWMWQHRALFMTADIVQVHDVFWWLLPVYLLVRSKVYTTFHGWETQYPVPITAKLQRLIYAALSKATIHVGDWIREFYWDMPTAVIYGGVREKVLALQSKAETKFPVKKIAFLGRLESDTAVPQYIQLLKKFKNKKIIMTWIGDGSLRGECEQWGEVTGFTKFPPAYLKDADVVFASSYLSILEAQALEKVVVALYDIPLKKRYLETYHGSSAMLVAGSARELAIKLEDLLADKKRFTELGKEAQKFASEQTWKRVFNTYEKIWQ